MYAAIQAPTANPTARNTPFQSKHLIEFGLKVSDVDVTTILTTSVRCEFCVYYGREQAVGQKRVRQLTTTLKHWKSPFRAENYKKHHDSQHPLQ